jgi:phosphomannomutase
VTTNDAFERAKRWAHHDIDESTRNELLALVDKGDQAGAEDRMAGPLVFGTAGLRGILGAGSNRMNRAVVARTTAGLAKHLLTSFPDAATRGVVVGYDARRKSKEFAEQAARVLAGQGIVAHLFPDLATTPQTAFATTQLGAVAGVMVTASHNPPEYNGYKVYWDNGAQIIPPQDSLIAAAIDAAPPADEIPAPDLEEARERGLVRHVDPVITERYLRAIEQLSLHPEGRDGMRIVYTPMHGVGLRTAMEALRRAGFENVVPVEKQAAPDGEFPTVHFPNPEEPGAMDLAFATARDVKADLILANDPDADRLAVAVPNRTGDGYLQLSGNQVGVLLAHYFLAHDPRAPRDRLFVTTIVSSPMLGAMALQEGARYEETLTGFKWIANRAMAVEAETGTTFVTGYEEALGYTVGTIVRDKDGVSAVAVFAEMAAYLRSQGRTVLDELELMYRKYGLFVSRQVSRWHRGLDGAERIQSIMAALRSSPPSKVVDLDVLAVRDYQQQVRRDREGVTTTLNLPKSNVLSFELAGGSRIVARPSGTEPKIKFYFDHRETMTEDESMGSAENRANERLDGLVEAFLGAAGC